MDDESEDGDYEEYYYDPYEEIENLFSYNPPTLTTETGHGWVEQNTKNPSPFWFYEKHLGQKLHLLDVKSIPPITNIIADTATRYVESIEAAGIKLPQISQSSEFRPVSRMDSNETDVTSPYLSPGSMTKQLQSIAPQLPPHFLSTRKLPVGRRHSTGASGLTVGRLFGLLKGFPFGRIPRQENSAHCEDRWNILIRNQRLQKKCKIWSTEYRTSGRGSLG